MQRPAADEVNVQMKHRLAGARTYVQHGAVAVFDSALPCDLGCGQVTASDKFRVFGGCLFEAGDVFFGNYENVGRTLRIQVFESKGVLIFVHLLRRNFAFDDAAE